MATEKVFLVGTGTSARLVALSTLYNDVKTQLGMVDAPDGSTADGADIADMKKNLLGVELMTMRRTAAGKRFYSKLLCAIGSASGAKQALVGRSFGEDIRRGEIKKVYIPRTRTLR